MHESLSDATPAEFVACRYPSGVLRVSALLVAKGNGTDRSFASSAFSQPGWLDREKVKIEFLPSITYVYSGSLLGARSERTMRLLSCGHISIVDGRVKSAFHFVFSVSKQTPHVRTDGCKQRASIDVRGLV